LVGVLPAITLPFRRVKSGVVESMGRSLESDFGREIPISRGKGKLISYHRKFRRLVII